jgi:hypothetical protein
MDLDPVKSFLSALDRVVLRFEPAGVKEQLRGASTNTSKGTLAGANASAGANTSESTLASEGNLRRAIGFWILTG